MPTVKVKRARNQGNGKHRTEVESIGERLHVIPYEMSPEGCEVTAKGLDDLRKQREAGIRRNIEAKNTYPSLRLLSLPPPGCGSQADPGYLYQRRELRRRRL